MSAIYNIGGMIVTYTGRSFYPLTPEAKDVCLEDIAQALSMICCFNGQVRDFYSVAERSIWLAQEVRQLSRKRGDDLRVTARLEMAALHRFSWMAYLPALPESLMKHAGVEGIFGWESWGAISQRISCVIAVALGFELHHLGDYLIDEAEESLRAQEEWTFQPLRKGGDRPTVDHFFRRNRPLAKAEFLAMHSHCSVGL